MKKKSLYVWRLISFYFGLLTVLFLLVFVSTILSAPRSARLTARIADTITSADILTKIYGGRLHGFGVLLLFLVGPPIDVVQRHPLLMAIVIAALAFTSWSLFWNRRMGVLAGLSLCSLEVIAVVLVGAKLSSSYSIVARAVLTLPAVILNLCLIAALWKLLSPRERAGTE